MSRTIHDVDAQRARWLRYRMGQHLTTETEMDFALGGLARYAEDPHLRLVFLPSDPDGDPVSLGSEALDWLKEPRPTPYGGRAPRWGHRNRATSNALVIYDQYRDDAGWAKYLALHRHGGVELAESNIAYPMRDARVFALRQIVGITWIAAVLQSEAAKRWDVTSPFELIVALRNANGAVLGSFAEGWAEPEAAFWDSATCIEDHVLLRWELDDGIDAESLALSVGDCLEHAFGSTLRRHLAHQGEYAGRFDPRFGF